MLNTISGGANKALCDPPQCAQSYNVYAHCHRAHLKRLIVGGMDRVTDRAHFQKRGMSTSTIPSSHRQLYQAYADYHDMMDLFEELLSSAAKEILGTYELEWQGYNINLTPGWPRITMAEAVKQHTGVDFMSINTDEEALEAAKSLNIELPKEKTWGNLLYECFDQLVESAHTTHVYSRPPGGSVAACQKKPERPEAYRAL